MKIRLNAWAGWIMLLAVSIAGAAEPAKPPVPVAAQKPAVSPAPSSEEVRRLMQQVQRLEARVVELEKKLVRSQSPDVIGGVSKLATDVVGGTLNMAGQTLDATGRLITGQPQRKPQIAVEPEKEDPQPKKKEKATFFGIPIE